MARLHRYCNWECSMIKERCPNHGIDISFFHLRTGTISLQVCSTLLQTRAASWTSEHADWTESVCLTWATKWGYHIPKVPLLIWQVRTFFKICARLRKFADICARICTQKTLEIFPNIKGFYKTGKFHQKTCQNFVEETFATNSQQSNPILFSSTADALGSRSSRRASHPASGPTIGSTCFWNSLWFSQVSSTVTTKR